MRIAFVCDWLTGMRGGERCLKAACELYPDADIFTLVYFAKSFSCEFEGHRITTSFIQKLPCNPRSFRWYLPLFPRAIESFDLQDYDLVVSFSHCVAKGVKSKSSTPHLCYCHTPVRYAWDVRDQYLDAMGFCRKRLISLFLDGLQEWDITTARRVNFFVANSRNTQQKIRRFYGRDSQVIYPPVDVERFTVSTQHDDYYLIVSGLVPYKRIDLAVQAFNQNGKRLIVAGSGPECKRLKKNAKRNVEFVENPDDQVVQLLYANCRAQIFPGEEDFGIVPVEAQACGKPVIAYGKGGALETVIGMDASDHQAATGVFFYEQDPESLLSAIEQFEGKEEIFKPENCRLNAKRFDVNRYKTEMVECIEAVMASRERCNTLPLPRARRLSREDTAVMGSVNTP